jgi:uncharacterized protein YrrD
MLNKATTLKGYTLHSLDGEIGKVKEFYFDDKHWMIRYLVADTGSWLIGRQVLISPHALVAVNNEARHISIKLTRKQIEDSPSLDTNKPVSLQFEVAYHGYYAWPTYWGGMYGWGAYPYRISDQDNGNEAAQREKMWDHHLRRTHEVRGYHIQAADGEIGHVADFLIDDKPWAIRYLVIDTMNWWPGRKILISPQWIENVSWNQKTVSVSLSRTAIKQSPEYTEASLLTRDYEIELHRHYDRNGYWADKQSN